MTVFETARKCIDRVCSTRTITEIVSGGAKGADFFGERYAKDNNIPLKIFKADWKKYGKGAGHIRNEEMAKYTDLVMVMINNNSSGSRNMIKNAVKYQRGLFVFEFSDQILVDVRQVGV